MSGLGSLGPLRLRVWGVLWGVLGLCGTRGLWGWCPTSPETLSPRLVSLCPSTAPAPRLASNKGLVNEWPWLRARWMASCFSWSGLVPQDPHWPSSLSLSLDSVLRRLWTRMCSWRKTDRSLVSCRVCENGSRNEFQSTLARTFYLVLHQNGNNDKKVHTKKKYTAVILFDKNNPYGWSICADWVTKRLNLNFL